MAQPHRNQILAKLAEADLALFEPKFERVAITPSQTLEDPNTPIEHVYFPESGIASVVAIGVEGQRIEVGIIGREGMSGLTVVLGNDRSPHHCFIQLAGEAQRITADDLREAMAASPGLHALMMRYVQIFSVQTAHTALANGSAKLEERLSRWLVMCHDRMDGDELPLTHEFLSLMLGVRRSGVTLAVHMLEGNGLIKADRGRLTILDRDGLIENAAGAYGVPEAEYARLIG